MQEVYEILRLAKDYMVLGIAAVAVIAVLFLTVYFIIYKKMLKGTRKIKPLHVILVGIFLCYIIVVIGATMMSRGAFYDHSYQLHLFYSYKEAWNSFNFSEWRNIILNILMFVPFGFLLPLVFKRLRKFWKTYLCSFAFTLAIELIQLIFNLGIFEVDDIFDNLLGAMIGYGLFSIVYSVYRKMKKRSVKALPVILHQLPLIFAVVMFSVIFITYANQELGNLGSSYIYKLPKSSFTVTSDVDFSEEKNSKMVYQTQLYSYDEVRRFAQNIFDNFSSDIDNERTLYYENTAFFYDNREHSIRITYNGGAFDYTDFSCFDNPDMNTNATQAEIETALKNMGIEIPAGLEFFSEGEGRYSLTADEIIFEDYIFDGTISLTYTADGKFSDMESNLIKYQPYKKFDLISEKDAYDALSDGKFKTYVQGDKDIIVKSVHLGYELDSKGYYQPVYSFTAAINGKAEMISISAIK